MKVCGGGSDIVVRVRFSFFFQAEEDYLLGREGKGALLESRTRVSDF